MKGLLFVLLLSVSSLFAQEGSVALARLQYGGGGDWYVSPTSLTNLIEFANQNLGANILSEEEVVHVGSSDLFNYPFVHMTGHGNVVFTNYEVENLRKYLLGGGFLHINDSYGMDSYVRTEMKKVFPKLEFIDVPYDHEIYHQSYSFPKGLPKIHEHDGNAPRGLAIFHEGRMLVYYNYESDLGDGWEDQEVHNDLPEIRLKALQMGANILQYVFEENQLN